MMKNPLEKHGRGLRTGAVIDAAIGLLPQPGEAQIMNTEIPATLFANSIDNLLRGSDLEESAYIESKIKKGFKDKMEVYGLMRDLALKSSKEYSFL